MADCSSSSEGEWEEEEDSAEEVGQEASPTPCLFCANFEADPLVVLDHCSRNHQFQLPNYVSRLGV